MKNDTKLYDAFGELLYCVAIADGLVQPEELDSMKEVLEDHEWGKAVQWSFQYEMKKKADLKDTYEKALFTLKENGPHPDYKYLVEVLETIAASDGKFQKKEGQVISIFQKSLRAHFKEYLDQNGLIRSYHS